MDALRAVIRHLTTPMTVKDRKEAHVRVVPKLVLQATHYE
jgi:hypothetical protein